MAGALRVTVTAGSLLRDVCVFADRLAAALVVRPHDLAVDDALVTLLPGERHTFRVTRRDGRPLPAAAAAVLSPELLDAAVRSAGELTA